MNKSHSKLIARLQPKAPPTTQNQAKPSLKRKFEGEEFKRIVRPKPESSSTRSGDELKIKIQLKKGIPSFFKSNNPQDPVHSSQRISRKENIPPLANKSQNMSKSTNARSDSVLTAIQKSLNKLGGKAPRTTTVDKPKTSSHTILEQKVQSKAALKSKFDELMKSVQEFGQKRCLFTDLKDLTNQMDNEYKPAFEVCNERILQIEKEFADRKVKQSQELENLKAKITTLKENQAALALSLSDKKQKNEKIESEERELENKIMNYDDFIRRNRELLGQLLNKKEDLSSFIIKIEEAISSTKEKVNSRYEDISTEEKKLLILEEMLHSKKQTMRTFLFLRGEKPSLENCNNEAVYRIHTHENARRIKLELNKSLPDHNPRFYEFDSIYHVNSYRNREKKIFATQDLKFYQNVLTTIFETEQTAGYAFFFLTHDKFSSDLFKELATMILQKYIDKNWSENSNVNEIGFDHKGKILSESLCPLDEFSLRIEKDEFNKENYVLTFQAKLKNMAAAKRFTFILVSGLQKDLISTLKKATTSTKAKKKAVSMPDITCENKDLMALLQNSTEGSSIYTILSMKTEDDNKPSTQESVGLDSLECLELLNSLSRLRG